MYTFLTDQMFINSKIFNTWTDQTEILTYINIRLKISPYTWYFVWECRPWGQKDTPDILHVVNSV